MSGIKQDVFRSAMSCFLNTIQNGFLSLYFPSQHLRFEQNRSKQYKNKKSKHACTFITGKHQKLQEFGISSSMFRPWVGFMGNVLQNYESVEKNHILRMPSTKQFARFIEQQLHEQATNIKSSNHNRTEQVIRINTSEAL